jgi:hypothetical protein
VGGLHRPHAALQPVEQAQIVGVAAKERLAQVHVGLDQAGEHPVAAGIDHPIVRSRGLGPDARDSPVAHGDGPLDDVEGVVHREDGCVADEEGGHWRGTV